MSSLSKKLFVAIFILYMIWGGYNIGMCALAEIGEICIGVQWVLIITGLPVTMIALHSNGRIGDIIFTALIGAIQWGGLAYWITHLITKRKKRQNVDNHKELSKA